LSEVPSAGVRCDLCGKRAVYFRASSGHRLCLDCLGRVLERSIRRRLSPLNALKPRARILIPITYYNTLASIGLADISALLKKGYGSQIFIALPDFVKIAKAPERFKKLNVIKVNVEPKPCLIDAVQAIHYDRLWSLKLAQLLDFNVILMPLTRTDVTLLAIEIPLRGYEDAWSMLNSKVDIHGVSIINALDSVEAEAIVSYAALSGYETSIEGLCTPKLETSRILRELKGLGPEVEFSSYKVVDLLVATATSRMAFRCPYCGNLTMRSDSCSLCKAIGVPNITVRIRTRLDSKAITGGDP